MANTGGSSFFAHHSQKEKPHDVTATYVYGILSSLQNLQYKVELMNGRSNSPENQAAVNSLSQCCATVNVIINPQSRVESQLTTPSDDTESESELTTSPGKSFNS